MAMHKKHARLGWTVTDRWANPKESGTRLRWNARAWDSYSRRYFSRAFPDGAYAEAAEWAKSTAEKLERPKPERASVRVAIERAPWETLVAIAQEICERYYPADIFTGSSGDPGPQLIVALRRVLESGEPSTKDRS